MTLRDKIIKLYKQSKPIDDSYYQDNLELIYDILEENVKHHFKPENYNNFYNHNSHTSDLVFMCQINPTFDHNITKKFGKPDDLGRKFSHIYGMDSDQNGGPQYDLFEKLPKYDFPKYYIKKDIFIDNNVEFYDYYEILTQKLIDKFHFYNRNHYNTKLRQEYYKLTIKIISELTKEIFMCVKDDFRQDIEKNCDFYSFCFVNILHFGYRLPIKHTSLELNKFRRYYLIGSLYKKSTQNYRTDLLLKQIIMDQKIFINKLLLFVLCIEYNELYLSSEILYNILCVNLENI